MDGERNIVQTVLEANNTFKDFSLSLLHSLSLHTHTHTHTHINLSLFLAERMKLSAGQQQLAASEARERQWGGKGTFGGFMEMQSGETLLGRQHLSKVGHVLRGRGLGNPC